MKKILAILLFVNSVCNAQTVQLRCGFYPNGMLGKIYTDTVYLLPKTVGKYFTGYGTFGSFSDSVRASISLTTIGTSGASTYNSTTGVLNIPSYSGGGSGWGLSGNSITAGSDFLGSTNNVSVLFRSNNVQRLRIDSLGRFLFNTTTSSGTTTPKWASLGGEYGTNAQGNFNNIKLRLYDDGTNTAGGVFGIGITTNSMDFQTGPTNYFTFYTNGVENARINANKSMGIGSPSSQNVLNIGLNGVVSSKSGIDIFSTLNIDATTLYNSGRIYGTFDGSGFVNARLVFAYPVAAGTFTDLMVLKNGTVGIGPLSTPTSTFHNQGSFATAYIAKSTSYTATINENVIEVTATGQTITLPNAAGISGRIYTVKLTASGSSTIATTSSQTIDGATTYSLSAQYKYVTVMSNNTQWIIIANN